MLFAISANDLPWVVQILQNAIRSLCASLCNVIYPLMAKLYDVFLEIGSILYNDTFSGIYDRISLIIGVFMVFRVIFWLIELLVNPDGIGDKEKNPGNIVKKVFISVLLLATTPRIFKLAFDIQHDIISEGVIEEIIVGENNASSDFNMGRFLAAEVFNNFLTNNPDPDSNKIDEDCNMLVADGNSDIETSVYFELKNYGTMNRLTSHKCLTARWKNSDGKSDQGEYKLDFSGLFAVGVGAFVTWMLLMYCISAGTRCVQLIFLQVIAPIPIMCYLTPKKDNMLSKWVKQCTTTYLDLFIRVGIISFVMLLIRELLSNSSGFLSGFESSEFSAIITIFLVLGLLTFAKKAPDLIQELLPKSVTKASGDFGLSWKKRTDAMVGGKLVYSAPKKAGAIAVGGTAGAIVGGYMGAKGGKGVGSRIMGGLSGAAKGFGTGSKKGNVLKNINEAKKNQAAYNNKMQQWRIAAGKDEDAPNTWSDYWSRKDDARKQAMGFETSGQLRERRTKFANDAADAQKNVLGYGKGKSMEKNTTLKAFGKDVGIAELDAKAKQADTVYQNSSVEKLLSTKEGDVTLKNFAREKYFDNVVQSRIARGETESQARAWVNSHNDYVEKNFEKNYSSLSDTDKYKLAEETMDKLQKTAYNAQKEFLDNEKQAAFTFLVSDKNAANVQNDFAKITELLVSDHDFAKEVCGDYIKKKKGLTPGTADYDNYIASDAEINASVQEMFDLEELDKVRLSAESGDTKAQDKFNDVFHAFDMFKTLKARYAKENMTPEAMREQANDKFNSSK